MADETGIDPGGARHLFNVIEAVADEIDEALSRVKKIRTSLPEPWGSDEYGQKFAKQREPNVELVLGYIGTASESVKELAREGRGAIEALVNQDIDNSANLS